MWDILVIFKKMPKVNKHPFGEYSSNLVTLTCTRTKKGDNFVCAEASNPGGKSGHFGIIYGSLV
jgi:hypothetical protein